MAEEFVDRLERILRNPISKLVQDLASLQLEDILNHFQSRLDLSQLQEGKLPDGFWAKWRYIWALRLASPSDGKPATDAVFESIDKQVEDIFDTYSQGAIFEPGKDPRSEKEFLTRLGLALRIREHEDLSFPEQFRQRLYERFAPFDESFFVPRYGLTFDQVCSWLEGLISELEAELNKRLEEFRALLIEIDPVRLDFGEGKIGFTELTRISDEAQWGKRLNENGEALQNLHVYSKARLQGGLSEENLNALLADFQLGPTREDEKNILYPHSENPLNFAFLVPMPAGSWYFLDPAAAFRVCNRKFERLITSDRSLKDKFLRNRDRRTEERVEAALRKLELNAEIHRNYYIDPGSNEKDVFFRVGRRIILVECKNSKMRGFAGKFADLLKFRDDFARSVQYGFDQALGAKSFILSREQAVFLDEKGRQFFTVWRDEIDEIYIVCIAENPRGPLGTDLSYFLEKDDSEVFPLALRLFDFESICERIGSSERLFDYLKSRERLHGHAKTGDELNYAGYYLRYGNLSIPENMFVTDDFSSYFDDEWYREKGVDIERNYPETPFISEMIRKGNRITFTDKQTGRVMDRVDIARGHPAYIEPEVLDFEMRGSNRNKPCPCGSGLKFKRCHGAK
jgi:hypothetical protein